MSRELWTISLLGFSFFLIFTSFQTGSMIQQTVVKSIAKDYDIQWNGYTSLCVIYTVFSLSNWMAPSTVSLIGSKASMIVGASTYCLFVANFLYPLQYGLYTVSVILGVGAAVIWTAQGNFLTVNSTPETVSRNAGVFWALFQCSMLFGNIFVYFQFRGETEISNSSRVVVYGVLTGLGVAGTILLFLLRGRTQTNVTATSPREAFFNAIILFKSQEVWYLSLTFFYSGIAQSFFSGIYGTSIGNTKVFGSDAQKLIGLSGMLIGLGEIVGGAAFGLLGTKTASGRRDSIVLIGFLVHTAAFVTIYLNLPFVSPISATSQSGHMESNLPLALTGSFLLGFGDACFITQIMSFLSSAFVEDSAPIFALFKFVQSIASAICFLYSDTFTLDIHIYILTAGVVIGTLSFCQAEWSRRDRELSTVRSSPAISSASTVSSSLGKLE